MKQPMIQQLVEVIVYAAALDLYTRFNRKEKLLKPSSINAMLDIVDWSKRPQLLSALETNDA